MSVNLTARKTDIKEIGSGIYELRQVQKPKDGLRMEAVMWFTEDELISIGQTASMLAAKRAHQEKTEKDDSPNEG